MFRKLSALKESFQSAEQIIRDIDFKAFASGAVSQFSETFSKLAPFEKKKLSTWIDQIDAIKAESTTKKDKLKALERLSTPDLIGDIFKSQLAHFAESKSITSHDKAKTILNGAGTLLNLLPAARLMILKFGVEKILPHLLLRSEIETFLKNVRSHLDEQPDTTNEIK